MVKLIELLKRREGLTQDEFCRYWKEVHASIALEHVPGIRKYVQNHPVRLGGAEAQFDGVAELWFDDMVALRTANKWYRSEDAKLLRDDEAKFLDSSKQVNLVCEEVIIK